MATVAEIILPLAVKSNFTYLPSPQQKKELEVGKRVLVNFGRNKLYTGVIRRILQEEDPVVLNKLKPIEEILDDRPILYELQLKLFEWIAFYYLCTEGEVLKAALPAALKPESSLRVKLVEGIQWDNLRTTDKEFALVESLLIQPVLTFKEVAQLWDIINPSPRLKNMAARGWVTLFQEVEERYKPKYKTYLKLSEACHEEETLRVALDSLGKAPKQEDLMMRVLSDFYQSRPTPKTETLKEIEVSAAAVKALVEKGFIIEEKVQIDRLELYGYTHKNTDITFTPEQTLALKDIRASWAESPDKPVLLHGVTGSGKTHLYIDLIKDALAEGRQVLYLLPEIGLTKQIIDRVTSEFGNIVGVYHSKFNDQERVEIWQSVRDKQYQIVIGVRSAIFLPFEDLGLIVVDEEHDTSFKQNNPAPRYHARDLAIYYARLANCPVILGSATPSFESYFNVMQGKFAKVTLEKRAIATHESSLELVDMRVERKKKEVSGVFSHRLLKAIEESLGREEQVILFQNRRGYSPYLVCHNCGHVPQCVNCDISLTYHKAVDHLRCHYCGHTEYGLERCPSCEYFSLRKAGIGTEKIEEQVKEHFPQAVVQRMDLDTTRTKTSFQQIIHRFELKQIDILVGTQMVSKGLDIENVTLVGVINADNVLSFPDFRSYEYAYQLLTQVGGRSGRSSKQGKVIIQSHMPENQVLRAIEEKASYDSFFQTEIAHRHELGYPPVSRLLRIEMVHKDRHFLESQSIRIEAMLRPMFGHNLLGPDYRLVARVRNQYRMQFLIKLSKSLSARKLRSALKKVIDQYYEGAEKKNLRIILDVDPS